MTPKRNNSKLKPKKIKQPESKEKTLKDLGVGDGEKVKGGAGGKEVDTFR